MTTHVEARHYGGPTDSFDITMRDYPKGKTFTLENLGEVTVCDEHSWAWKKTAVVSQASTTWTEINENPQKKGDHRGDTQLSVNHGRVGQSVIFEQQENTLVENQGGYESILIAQTAPISP